MNIHDREHEHGIDAQRWQAQEAARQGDPAADALSLIHI